MKYLVNAVVVTYNRIDLLKQAIDGLLQQSYKLNKIIVVNNASTDGTASYLQSLDDVRIKVIHLEKNEGGAGGFYHGVKASYEIGGDFTWLMDDDTITVPNSLEELMNSYEIVNYRNIGFIASNVMFRDGTPCHMNICRPDYYWNEYASEGIIRVTHCSFVAMLVPNRVIKSIGYPIRDYFIWGDDGEYSTRITAKYEGYICARSKVLHFMNENVGVDIWNVEPSRIDRFYYFYRNWMCTHRMRDKKAASQFEKDANRLIRDIRHSNTRSKREKIKTIRRGIRDGKRFYVKIDYPSDHTETKADTWLPERGIKHRLFRIARYFLIKYDIYTQGYVTYCKELYKKYIKTNPSKKEKIHFLLKGLFETRLFDCVNKVDSLHELLGKVSFNWCRSEHFAYSVDVYKSWKIYNRQMANCAPDYYLLLEHGLNDLTINSKKAADYADDNNHIIGILSDYIDRMCRSYKRSGNRNVDYTISNLRTIKNESCKSLEDALQRILFVNQLMWQTRHIQIGLGRLDMILEPYITDDISDSDMDSLFQDFIKVLHNYYWLKSEEMPGDTGQIMILGGKSENGGTVINRVTYSIIRSIKKLQLPDPKVLLRVDVNTPDDLWDLAISCIATGIGSPLIANDEAIIPRLKQFKYKNNDAINYVTSACWEPIAANSREQNNIGVFDFVEALNLTMQKEDIGAIQGFDDLIKVYLRHLNGHVGFMVQLLDSIKWDKDPLMSFFTTWCRDRRTDISQGGGKYNNYGILSVGIVNAVNSLMNIKRFVYDKQSITLRELVSIRNKNYKGYDEVWSMLKNAPKEFGNDKDINALRLTNQIVGEVEEAIKEYRNVFGGKVKFGLSSPGYIIVGKNQPASFDGRRDYEPYAMHISADDNQDVTALLNFSSEIKYSKAAFNGNVTDFTMTPSFIMDNKDKFMLLLKGAVKKGIYEIQMNVVDAKKLIEEKKNPGTYPNLIVRVWGFSAYFKDLPEEYQDYVIERALKSEAAYN